jgi:capsule polysaccharide export protein KpsE/RkpR
VSATLFSPPEPPAVRADELSALRDTVASLEAQLVSLYADREAEAAEAAALAAAVESLDAQARAWYASVERLGGRTVDEAADALASYEAQLEALYADVDAGAPGAESR